MTDAGVEGGILYVDLEKNEYHRILSGDFRGIDVYGDRIYAVSQTFGVTVLDRNLRVIETIGIGDYDFHGLGIYKGEYALITETSRDAVGIYSFPDFKRVREIRITDSSADHHHINALRIVGDRVLMSMLSQSGSFKTPSFAMDGAILEYDIPTGQFTGVLKGGQRFPHSVFENGGDLCFCGSLDMNLSDGDAPLAQFNGFTRGLARDGRFFFVGQSLMRHLERVTNTSSNISMDAGFHIFDPETHTSRFVPLPTRQIYEILPVDSIRFSLGSEARLNTPDSVKNLPDLSEWNNLEENGRWMKTKTADIRLFADTPARSVVIDAISGYPGSLHLTVYANRFPIGKALFEEAGYKRIHMDLPAEGLGEVVITFETDRIWSPCRVFGTGDIRELGIAVSYAALSKEKVALPEKNPQIPGNQSGRSYEDAGSEAKFSDRSSEKCLLDLSQWHEFELEHRWMAGDRADLVLYTRTPANLLRIKMESSCPEPISCKVYVNRFLVGSVDFAEPGGRDVSFKLPGSVTGPADITLETDRVWRPCDFSDIADERTLGIAVTLASLAGDDTPHAKKISDESSGPAKESRMIADIHMGDLSSEEFLADSTEWNDREPDQRWVAKSQASLSIPLTEPVLRLKIKAFSDYPGAITSKVFANDTFVADMVFPDAGPGEYDMLLPEEMRDSVRIRFETDRIWRPCKVFNSHDERLLGIAIVSVTLST